MAVTFEQLEESLQRPSILTDTKKVIEAFLASTRDWPELNWPDWDSPVIDFHTRLKTLIGEEPTQSSIEKYMSTMDFIKNSWMAESLGELLAVYDIYAPNITIAEIIADLDQQCSPLR